MIGTIYRYTEWYTITSRQINTHLFPHSFFQQYYAVIKQNGISISRASLAIY